MSPGATRYRRCSMPLAVIVFGRRSTRPGDLMNWRARFSMVVGIVAENM